MHKNPALYRSKYEQSNNYKRCENVLVQRLGPKTIPIFNHSPNLYFQLVFYLAYVIYDFFID